MDTDHDVSSDGNSNDPAVAAAAEEMAGVARDQVEALADAGQKTIDAGQQAVDAGQHGAAMLRDAATTAMDETAKAFGEARGRLNAVTAAGLDQGQAMLGQFKAGTDAFTAKLGGGYGQASHGWAEFNAKAVQAWRANAEATIAHWQSLAGVKSWSEMIALNASHTRKQIEAITAQTRDLADLAGRLARESADTKRS